MSMHLYFDDIFYAYRKAKMDCFFERAAITRHKFYSYEQDLEANLRSLMDRLNESVTKTITAENFLGGVACIPKSADFSEGYKGWSSEKGHFFSTSPETRWDVFRGKYSLDYRTVIDAEVDAHIVSALWIMEVGQYLDQLLDDKTSYGYRIARGKPQGEIVSAEKPPANQESPHLFRPYFYQFKEWRERGIGLAKSALEHGDAIIAMTMDVKGFFHNVDPGWILQEEWLEALPPQSRGRVRNNHEFSNALVEAIRNWNQRAGFPSGVPIGLSCSKVLANAAMWRFDRDFIQAMAPIYYGRYVDDILAVFPDEGICRDNITTLRHIEDRFRISGGMELKAYRRRTEHAEEGDLEIKDKSTGNFVFSRSKQKIFVLQGEPGTSYLKLLKQGLNKLDYEFARMPGPVEASQFWQGLSIHADPEQEPDALRVGDPESFRRLEISLLLRNLRRMHGIVDRKSMVAELEKARPLFIEYALSPRHLFDFFRYGLQFISIHAALDLNKETFEIFDKILESFDRLQADEKPKKNEEAEAHTERAKKCREFIELCVVDAVACASESPQTKTYKRLRKRSELSGVAGNYLELLSPKDLVYYDLAFIACREYLIAEAEGVRKPSDANTDKPPWRYPIDGLNTLGVFLAESSMRGLGYLESQSIPRHALLMPTRPLSSLDLLILKQRLLTYSDWKGRLSGLLRGVRGISQFDIHETIPEELAPTSPVIEFSGNKGRGKKLRIALAVWETNQNDEYVPALNNRHVISTQRLQRFQRITDSVFGLEEKVDLLIFPELSVPPAFAHLIGTDCLLNGVSVVFGEEYVHGLGTVSNNAMAYFCADMKGYPLNIFLRQSKLIPAAIEREVLDRSGLQMEPHPNSVLQKNGTGYTDSNRPIFKWGDFYFAIMICNELTNIDYRRWFRGKLDALIVIEWNRDVNTFAPIVESASSDLSCYVIQVNNRKYGDCRIRKPGKEAWDRDVVRVHGGAGDYFVVGEIDIEALRAFHSNDHPDLAHKEFKPFPTGFKVSGERDIRNHLEDENEETQ